MLAAQLRSSDTEEAGPNGSVAPAPLSDRICLGAQHDVADLEIVSRVQASG